MYIHVHVHCMYVFLSPPARVCTRARSASDWYMETHTAQYNGRLGRVLVEGEDGSRSEHAQCDTLCHQQV